MTDDPLFEYFIFIFIRYTRYKKVSWDKISSNIIVDDDAVCCCCEQKSSLLLELSLYFLQARIDFFHQTRYACKTVPIKLVKKNFNKFHPHIL